MTIRDWLEGLSYMSLIVTFASLLLPIFGDGYTLMLISFSLLGIGNALIDRKSVV